MNPSINEWIAAIDYLIATNPTQCLAYFYFEQPKTILNFARAILKRANEEAPEIPPEHEPFLIYRIQSICQTLKCYIEHKSPKFTNLDASHHTLRTYHQGE